MANSARNPKQTGAQAASAAGKTLNSNAPKAAKAAAASALSQTPPAKRTPPKKRGG